MIRWSDTEEEGALFQCCDFPLVAETGISWTEGQFLRNNWNSKQGILPFAFWLHFPNKCLHVLTFYGLYYMVGGEKMEWEKFKNRFWTLAFWLKITKLNKCTQKVIKTVWLRKTVNEHRDFWDHLYSVLYLSQCQVTIPLRLAFFLACKIGKYTF